ncbi:uncharacterized protein METZ01_LOCUS129838 [marine metagenome]|uniref:Arsenical-resistance protein n=1 Tax=marine metagenome TaxID=408172 RepID=A0A381YIV3_9ZZZZ
MGFFQRYLSIWIALCIAAGVLIGNWLPEVFRFAANLQWAHVNIVIALCIWVMVYPMMSRIDFSSIRDVGKRPKGLVVTLTVNWLIKPFTMACLAWFFFKVLFVDLVEPSIATEYIAGMILLGVAPCTAMVFVWSQLTRGNPNYTLVQVSINDVIMIFAFAPIAGFLLGISNIEIPWSTLILSVVLYVVIPLLAGILTRYLLIDFKGEEKLQKFLRIIEPMSMLGLLLTVLLLFGFQAEVILNKPQIIILIAIPLVLQTYGIFAISYVTSRLLKLSHDIAAPVCLIGTSNFFELAVAVAISLFGLHSGAALATVVGVLVEVPVMLSLVYIVNRTRPLFST